MKFATACVFTLAATSASARPGFHYGVNQDVPAAVGPNFHINYAAAVPHTYTYAAAAPVVAQQQYAYPVAQYAATPVVQYAAAPVAAGCRNNQGSLVPCNNGPFLAPLVHAAPVVNVEEEAESAPIKAVEAVKAAAVASASVLEKIPEKVAVKVEVESA